MAENKIKVLHVPSMWHEGAQHWVWSAEMITRHCNKDKFEMNVVMDLDRAEQLYPQYDLIVPWYVTKTPPTLPRDKAIIIAHSRYETGCLGWEVAGKGVVSKYLYDYIQKQENIDYNLHIVNYGIDTDFWKPLPKPESDKIKVGWVGSPDSKYLDLAKAVVQGLDVEFLPLNIQQNPRSIYGMPNYYNSIDVLLVTSLEEGFHRPTIEAMSCGVAVLSNNVGIASEVLEPIGSGGWEYHWDEKQTNTLRQEIVDGMRKALQELTKSSIAEMGQRNRELICRDWTWEKKIGAWEKLFEESYETTKR